MATVGHIAAGIAIAQAGGGRRDYLAVAVVTAASVSPDIDLVFGINHRGPTHSIGFAAIVALVVALVLRLSSHPTPRGTAILCFVAVLSHIALDFLTVSSPIAALWPITSVEFKFAHPILPSVPLDDRIATLRGLVNAATEMAWSAMLIAAGVWIGARMRGRSLGLRGGR